MESKLPFFVEDQSGKNIYAITDLRSFSIVEEPETTTVNICMDNRGVIIVLGMYGNETLAKRELDKLIDSIVNGCMRYSFCANRILNWTAK